jgi:hypothetical protein
MLPCFNGGTCTETSVGGFVCVCLPNFTGVRCEDIPATMTTRAMIFVPVTTISTTTTTTVVQIIRTVDVCTNHSCLNAGSCMPNGVGGFFCQCLNGFVGNRCEARGRINILFC